MNEWKSFLDITDTNARIRSYVVCCVLHILSALRDCGPTRKGEI
jgi:hypothetical protein